MVKQHAVFLGDGGRRADNMDDRNIFGVGSGNGVKSRQFTDTKGSDQSRYALDTGVSICSVTSIQFIDASDPIEPRLG